MEMAGTKWVIFQEAVSLFSRKGYAAVSMNQIAAAAGIRPSSIYNHFPSKDALLDHMYRFYRHHAAALLPPMEDLLAGLEHCTPQETLQKMVYVFPRGMESILYSILSIAAANTWDTRAGELLEETFFRYPTRYATTLLRYMVEKDLIEPLDVEAFAANYACICHSTTLQMLSVHPVPLELWMRTLQVLFDSIQVKNHGKGAPV